MRIQIDTKLRTIKVDENVKFKELIKVLKNLLPKEWEEYILEASSIIYWTNPIPYYPYTPWRIGNVTYGTSGESVPLTTTVYNVEVMD
jgi:hypothetical protein